MFKRSFLRLALFRDSNEFLTAHLSKRQPNGINSIPGVNLGILRPKDMPLGRLSIDIDMMKSVLNQSYEETMSLFL